LRKPQKGICDEFFWSSISNIEKILESGSIHDEDFIYPISEKILFISEIRKRKEFLFFYFESLSKALEWNTREFLPSIISSIQTWKWLK
jgi:hypothetical protein